ncbi:TraR/DksA family transcriptional regulator [Gryllotalpicola koreensis]|uniref:Zinc finger DksA/TraR C4-type domain-containing protein n=1 Tax=Gryllotalpicola koreensis TaxID=993086 RepID=A0ABP7ZWH6_9MICO
MTERDEIERMLRSRLSELESRASALDDALAALGGLRDASTDDEHDPDGAPVSGEWSRLTGIRHEIEAEIAATNAALTRLAAGGYGVCARCGSPIAPARLAARPTATLCIACAELAGRRP